MINVRSALDRVAFYGAVVTLFTCSGVCDGERVLVDFLTVFLFAIFVLFVRPAKVECEFVFSCLYICVLSSFCRLVIIQLLTYESVTVGIAKLCAVAPNDFESGGTRPAQSAGKNWPFASTFLALQIHLVQVLVSAFVMVSTV